MGAKAISLMTGMLKMDPKQRLTALEALGHSYFDSVREEEIQELIDQNAQEKTIKQPEVPKPAKNKDINRSKDASKRNTSTDKHLIKPKKNPYSLPIGASPPQIVKKKYTNWLYKDRKSSNSIKNLLQGRSSSKDVSGKRNIGISSYNNTAYALPKNHRNMPGSDVLRENQSMSTYIPASFNGVYLQNMKNPTEGAEYDYEIGGEFGNKASKQPNKLDNSMGLPSQVYGTEELKNSVTSSISGMITKGIVFEIWNFIENHRKIPSLSPSNRSEENKSNLKNYQTTVINKVVNRKNKRRRKHLAENLSNDITHLESINETTVMNPADQKNSYYEEEKSQRTIAGLSSSVSIFYFSKHI